MEHIQKDNLQDFLMKEVDLISTEITILNALLAAPSLQTPVEDMAELKKRADKIAEFSMQFGMLSGKLEAYKSIIKHFITVKQ